MMHKLSTEALSYCWLVQEVNDREGVLLLLSIEINTEN